MVVREALEAQQEDEQGASGAARDVEMREA